MGEGREGNAAPSPLHTDRKSFSSSSSLGCNYLLLFTFVACALCCFAFARVGFAVYDKCKVHGVSEDSFHILLITVCGVYVCVCRVLPAREERAVQSVSVVLFRGVCVGQQQEGCPNMTIMCGLAFLMVKNLSS